MTKLVIGICRAIYARAMHNFVPWPKELRITTKFPDAALARVKVVYLYTRVIPLFIFAFLQGHELQAQNCTVGTTSRNIDLSSSPNAVWQTPAPVSSSGQCCGAASGHQCMELVVTLHPDANGISIVFTTPVANVYYSVNCGPTQPVTSNTIELCFDQNDPGPHHISFCRSGTQSFEFAVFSVSNDINVTLDPYSPVCEGSGGFMLTGGSPLGGSYYINGELMPFFNVGFQGPGDHEIVYQYSNPVIGCVGFAVQTLTVVKLPEISWVVEAFCEDEGMVPLNGASPPGGIYSGNLISDNHFNIGDALPGNYVVKYDYYDIHGCHASSSGTILVNEPPLATTGPDQSIASGTTTSLSAASGGTDTYSYSWQPAHLLVNANAQNPQTLPISESTVFTLTVTNTATGCQSTDEMLIYVTGGPIHISKIASLPDAICLGSSTSLRVFPGGGSGNYNYTWTANPPDASLNSTQASPTVSPLVNTTYTVVVRDNNNSTADPASASLSVAVNPLPVVTIDMQETVCANTPNFALSGGLPAGGTYYLLDMGGEVLSLPYINFDNFLPQDIGAGNYQVMYEYFNPVTGCRNFATQPFTILPWLKAQFYTSRDDLCVSNHVNIANHSAGANTYVWNFGDGSSISNQSAANFTHDFPDVDYIADYTIRLTTTNAQGCTDAIQRKVKVYPPVIADFTASETEGCSSLDVEFTSHSEGPILYHFWDFGDGTFSIEKNPNKTFHNNSLQDTTFVVTLSILSTNYFCSSTHSIPITVYPAISAGFTSTPVFGCSELEVEFGNLATGALSYFWDFGNGQTSTDENPDPQIYVNTTDIVQTFTIMQVVSNLECTDTITNTLEVYPSVIAAMDVSVLEGCGPLEVVFTNLSSPIATHIDWDFGDGGTSSDENVIHTFENNTSSTIIYTVWLKVRSEFFCYDSTFVEIEVRPYIKADFDFFPAEACNLHQVTINNMALGATDYSWSMDDGTTYTYNGDSTFFSHTFIHDFPDPRVYNIKLVVTNAQGCMDSLERPLTIFPKIEAGFTPSVLEGCTPLNVSFINETTGANSHRWEFGDGGSSTQISPQHTFTNTSYTNDTIFDVWLYTSSQYHCRDSVHHQIRVFPDVKADFIVDENSGCSPFLVTIENYSLGNQSLNWSFGDNTTSTDMDGVLTHVFENKTDQVVVYEIELIATSPNGCTDTLIREITVYPEVNISFTNIIEGCHPLEVSFDNTTENANYYAWNFGDGILSDLMSPDHVFYNFSHIAATTYDVSLYASSVYGCFATLQSQIEVFPKPGGNFLVTNSPGCSPHEIIIDHTTLGATDFIWNFGDGVETYPYSGNVVTHLYNHEPGTGPGYFNISLITENDFACLDTLIQQVVIFPNIKAEFEANILEGCHPLEVNFTNQSYGATAAGAYFWEYGNGNTSHNLQNLHTHLFQNFSHTRDTVYTVRLTAFNQNHCFDTTSIQIRVLPRPKASFSVPNTPGCAPHDIIISNFSEGVLNYTWNMGDGETMTTNEESFTHLYHRASDQGPGLFTINLSVDNEHGCMQTASQQIVIYPEVSPDFITQNEGCHPHTAFFENLSSGGELLSWSFGNGNTSHSNNSQQTFLNFSHTESKVYNVNLRVESTWGCMAQVDQDIVVRPVPKPLFELTPFTGCAPFTPDVHNLSIGGTEFHWNMGNGESNITDSIFTHTWENKTHTTVLYPITLTTRNEFGCEASNNQITTVYPEVVADFTTIDDVWAGCSPLTLKFSNTSIRGDFYHWDFANDNFSTSASPLQIFDNHGIDNHIYPVQLMARSVFGCSDTIVKDVTVFPSPEAYFSAQPQKQPYPNSDVTFTNRTNPGYWNFNWEFGDGNHTHTTLFDPLTHTYIWDESDMSTKEYVVALMVSNDHCTDMHTEIVTITSPVPKAEFTSIKSGCVPFTVQFSNQSMYAHSFRWYFGDGGFSLDPAPSYMFVDPGYYEVLMVAIGDGGKDTTYHYVEVLENPTALFELESPHLNIPEDALKPVNKSILSDYFYWDFGDGNTSYDFEPEYYYTEPGIYDITLVATRNSQPLCYDSISFKSMVRVDESCKIIFPDAFMPLLSGPNGGHFNLNSPSTTVFHPVFEGIDDYALEIYNRWGELIFRSDDVMVGWDGYHKGKLSQMDVYVWKVTGRCTNGRSFIQSGDVTLYR